MKKKRPRPEKKEPEMDKRNGWIFGWKEIGSYLGVCAKTAYIYSCKYDLPISRMPSSRPAANVEELNRWLDSGKPTITLTEFAFRSGNKK